MKKNLGVILKTILPLGVGVYLLWYFFTSMSESSVAQFKLALREANYFWIFLSLIFGLLPLLSRAARWKYVLEPIGHPTPFWNRYHSLMIGYLMNLTIPRAGEATRAAMLYRSDKVPFSKSFGTIVVERAIDMLMLGGVTMFTIFVGGADFLKIWEQMKEKFGVSNEPVEGGLPWKYLILGLIILAFLLFALKAYRDLAFRAKIREFIAGLMNGVFAIFKSKSPFAYIGHTLAIWSCYIIMFILPFYSLESTSDIPFRGLMIAFFAGSLGVTFTNGGIGTYPLLVGMVISFYLIPSNAENAEGIGNALGMIIWVSQTLMMVILGFISLLLLPKKYSKNDESTTSTSQ
jgi:uncharacterized membrane protein YbhN (UPF0104 family)